MANKTPPLVIPVVIDSTGVDKGLSNVGSRLRRGVSGTGVGGGGAGGGFGGGGALAAAALGAGAGIVASRSSQTSKFRETGKFGFGYSNPNLSQVSRRFPEIIDKLRNSTLVGRHLMAVADTASYYRSAYGSASRGTGDLYNESMKHISHTVSHRAQRLATSVGLLARSRKRGAERFASAFDNLMSLKSVVGVGAVAATATAGFRFAQNFNQNTSDISNLQGSPLYGMMRNVQKRNFQKGPQPTILQSFLGGSLTLSGGQETMIEKDVKAAVSATGDIFTGLGLAYEYARRSGVSGTLHAVFLRGLGL